MNTIASRRRAAETRELWEQYKQTGDLRLRNRIVTTYSPLVRYIAVRKVRDLPARCELDDLVSAGLVALIESIERWEPQRGTSLEHFAWPRIHGAMLDELRRDDWAPRRLRRKERALTQATEKLTAREGRAPQEDEVANELGVARAQLAALRADISRTDVSSLNATISGVEDGAIERVDVVASREDEAGDPLHAVMRNENRREVISALSRLTKREREVAVLLYVKGVSQREAAEILGVTESRVSQLHSSLRKTLRRAMEEAGAPELAIA